MDEANALVTVLDDTGQKNAFLTERFSGSQLLSKVHKHFDSVADTSGSSKNFC